jgi:hypothetical protein
MVSSPQPDETIFQKFNDFSSMQLTARRAPAPSRERAANAGPGHDRCYNAEVHGASVAGTELKMPSTAVACKAVARSILANGEREWQRPRWSGYTTHNDKTPGEHQ